MNLHALEVLEFPRVLDAVAGFTSSSLGAEHVRALAPGTDRLHIENEHARVAALRVLRGEDPPLRADPATDLRSAVDRLRVPGLSWTAEQLRDGRRMLESARRSREALSDEKRAAAPRAVLAAVRDALWADRAMETELVRCITDDATVADAASPTLRRVRRELRASEGELVRILERQLERLDESQRVPDMSVTVRNGRYVIPVRRDGRAALGGIVHDASASGATLFVEPPAAVEFGNRLRELEAEEREEVERILAELTDRLRPRREELLTSLQALAVLDSLHARAAFAERFMCTTPEFASPSEGWAINDGRHPLLLVAGVPTVPFDLELAAAERTLVVSGPNTGGKTVLLKAVGLLSAMAQAGIPATVGVGSRLAIFDDYFADIGDEQSIQASLSTFSAHLRNLAEILAAATPSSLVLVDELGSGTDPLEGAALGWAILEELTRRGACTLASSHLGTLKELAGQVPGVVNASLEFDAERLAPTYRFVKGVPGRSYGISIARRLSLPEHVLARAEERVPGAERDLAALVAKLEEQQRILTEREHELEQMVADARQKTQRVAARERNVRERERDLEQESRRDARKYLLNARAEIERLLRDMKRAATGNLDDAARAARQHVEQMIARQAGALEQLDAEESAAARRARPRGDDVQAVPIVAGDFVTVETLGGKTGRVLEIRGEDAQVAVGSLKVTVPLASLTKSAAENTVAVAVRGDSPDEVARTEVDLRGLHGDEMETILFRALDDAIRAALPALRIIHGKGTGVLRERVAELLSKDTRVRQFRLGAWNEGGTGVTVAELG